MKRLEWAGLADGKTARFVLIHQDSQEFCQLLFFASSVFGVIKAEKFSGEALAFRRLLDGQAVRKVMVISTDVHLRRVALTFAAIFRDTAIEFLYCPLPARFAHAADGRYVISEIIKLTGYRVALSAPEWASRRLMRLTGWGQK